MPHKGACVLIPYNDVPHLFVSLNDPCPDGECLMVMVTSIRGKKAHDTACEFKGGEHPFIVHPSYMLYRMAELRNVRHVNNMIAKHVFVAKDDMNAGDLGRICKGVFDSDETRARIIAYADKQGV